MREEDGGNKLGRLWYMATYYNVMTRHAIPPESFGTVVESVLEFVEETLQQELFGSILGIVRGIYPQVL